MLNRKEIQIGALGRCFIYQHPNYQPKRAYKLIKDIDTQEFKIFQEIYCLQQKIKTKSIITIYEIQQYQEVEKSFISIELGLHDLQECIENNNLDDSQLITLFCRILIGVIEFHQLLNKAHQYLQPSNFIAIDNSKSISFKLCSFNKYAIKNTQGPIYKAPEQLRHQPQDNQQYFGFEVDVWSIGCIFYYIIAKQHLFELQPSQTLEMFLQTINQEVIDEKINLLKSSTLVKDIIKSMISLNIHQRKVIYNRLKKKIVARSQKHVLSTNLNFYTDKQIDYFKIEKLFTLALAKGKQAPCIQMTESYVSTNYQNDQVQATAHFPNLYKGRALLLEKRYSEAIEEFDRSSKNEQNKDVAYYSKGNALEQLGQIEQAIEMYKLAISINQNQGLYHYSLLKAKKKQQIQQAGNFYYFL